MLSPQEILKQYWGYDSFRSKQEDAIHSILDAKDTLTLLPTLYRQDLRAKNQEILKLQKLSISSL